AAVSCKQLAFNKRINPGKTGVFYFLQLEDGFTCFLFYYKAIIFSGCQGPFLDRTEFIIEQSTTSRRNDIWD
ncbi:MAG: hypothetical protein ACYC5R_12145, partial [Melioribacteraceae bacterium]